MAYILKFSTSFADIVKKNRKKSVTSSITNILRKEIFAGSVPAYCTSILGYRYMFSGCQKLRVNIANIIPGTGFLSRRIKAIDIFKNCSNLTGIVPADLLWDDANVIWSDTANAFAGCSESIRAQVPVTWGGTNTEIQA